jgi:hypothetical protein
MAEAIISPGVFITENDLTQIPQGPIEVGSSLLGPTVIGKVNVPTVVTSYAEYKQLFGSTFISGGAILEYLTSIAAMNYFEQGGASLLVTRIASASTDVWSSATASVGAFTSGETSFMLQTLGQGRIMNNTGGTVTNNGVLPSGSSVNIRWEINQVDTASGQFTLLIRRGDDYSNNKTVLETWSNLSLDPNQNNYVAYVIGDQKETVATDSSGEYYIQYSGSYQNKSKYVRVSGVSNTPGYLNSFGQAQSQFTGSMPRLGSGSLHGAFGGAAGSMIPADGPLKMFQDISATGNIQGVAPSDYNVAIGLLENKDAYAFNSIYAPGLNNLNAAAQISNLVLLSQERGDNIAVVDMVGYGSSIDSVVAEARKLDSSYAATYWPWVQVRSMETGKLHFVPASTVVPAAFEYNDRISAEWFAPAGFNRGGVPSVVQPERRISINDRNNLYIGKVNPIATFPGVGTVIYGQKTLQAQPSALDRVNVRRLLIALKRFIGGVGDSLVFEPNVQATRTKFLSQVNPFLEYVQQRQGLYAFQVVMDETNNTPDTIDRNQLIGSIYLQPTRVAEFILLDFNILPTGVTFGQ